MENEVLKEQPISQVKWIRVEDVNPNDYNPNIVAVNEMMGLKNSLLNNGWIFPITVNPEGFIIDGYHRWWLSKNDKDVRRAYNGWIPVCIIEKDLQNAICMTITMNSAKGTHQSSIMHDLITRLYNEFGMTKEEIATKCTMTVDEVDLLLQESVFSKLNIDKHTYSKGWVPKKNK